MSNRAERKALDIYPEKAVIVYGPYPTTEPSQIDDNKCYRDGFIKGYEQAEKDVIERACEWLSRNYDIDLARFRKAMEEE
jgi:hypothetical protein